LIFYRGPRELAKVAFTFDDGPSTSTPLVLDLLARHRVKATFFMVGSQVERHPDVVVAVRDAGHEIGSHSMRHHEHQHAERELAVTDMLEGAAAIERVLGIEPRLYRGPYGQFAPGTLAEAERRGWACVLWSAEGSDWRSGETAAAIVERVLPDLREGAIVLLHDGRRELPTDRQAMLEALEQLLAEGARRGLTPVTVSELLS
jgi:peptidoglycan/xylan/chitin deacetylase (PgdA/CDA1 family)